MSSRLVGAYRHWLHDRFRRDAAHVAAARVACAFYLLCSGDFGAPRVGELPVEAFVPPLGPFQLLGAFPPQWLLDAIRWLGLLCTWAFLFGRWPRWTGLVITLCALVQSGVTFSIGGKIDHTILLVVLPCLLGAAEAEARRERDASGWPFAVLSLCVGFALFSAGFAKLTSGWLSPADSSVHGYLLRNYHVLGRGEWLGPWAAGFDVPWLWEGLDWTTVVLETSFLLGPFWPRLLRLQLVAMALLHVGILLLLEISFAHNTVAYAALLVWPRAWTARLCAVDRWLASPSTHVVALVALLGATVALWLPAPAELLGMLLGKTAIALVELGVLVGLSCLTLRPGLVWDGREASLESSADPVAVGRD